MADPHTKNSASNRTQLYCFYIHFFQNAPALEFGGVSAPTGNHGSAPECEYVNSYNVPYYAVIVCEAILCYINFMHIV